MHKRSYFWKPLAVNVLIPREKCRQKIVPDKPPLLENSLHGIKLPFKKFRLYFRPNIIGWTITPHNLELLAVGDRLATDRLRLGDRLWALEIAYWKLCFYGQLFCMRQTSQFSQFYRMSLAELCALLINIFEKLHLINSEANLRLPQHLNSSFLWH